MGLDFYGDLTATGRAARGADAPFTANGGIRRFDLDGTPDSIDLVAGVYEIVNTGSDMAAIRCGSAVGSLTDKGAEIAGQYIIPAGATLALVLADPTALHGIATTSTTTLCLMRKVSL